MKTDCPTRCRGGVYIAVLATTSMITVIGISGIMLAQVEREISDATLHTGAARLDAQSALAIALSRVSAEAQWNLKYPSKQWQDAESFGQGKWSFMLEYDQAAADAGSEVELTITAMATRDPAARAFSMDVRAKTGSAPTNVLGNGAFDDDVSGWAATASGNLRHDSAYYHTGPGSARFEPGVATEAMFSDVLPDLVNGVSYQLEAWVEMTGASDNWIVSIYHNSGGSFKHLPLASGYVSSGGFTKLSGSGKITWTGADPTIAELRIFTATRTNARNVDSVSLILGEATGPVVEAIPGTFRQRTIE